MKALLEFDLPEDSSEFKLAANAVKWYAVLWNIDNELRSQIKHAPDTMHDEYHKALQDVRNKLSKLMFEYNLKFD
jgi:hypothetical protein